MADELIVVGGGAAGMMAAISAAETGAAVRLLERNPKVGITFLCFRFIYLYSYISVPSLHSSS